MTMPPPSAANTDPQVHLELQALKTWRDDAVKGGRLHQGDVTDKVLTEIVLHARKHIPEVQNRLPHPMRGFAEEIVDVQHRAGRVGAHPPEAPPPPRRSAESATTRAESSEVPTPDAHRLRDLEASFAPITTLPARSAPMATIRPRVTARGLRLRWPAPQGSERSTFHRVVARDDVAPYSPQGCALIDIVSAFPGDQTLVSTVDDREPSSAMRFFAVFESTGRDEDEAFDALPTLVAEGSHVFGVADLEIREEDGLVVGRWRTRPGVRQVLVYRIPVDQLASGAGADPNYLLDAPDPLLSGFVDHDAEPGRRYRYDLVVEVDQGGVTVQSQPMSVEVAISAPLVAVSDLTVDRRYAADGSVRFDVSWTKPAAGTVRLYRTEKGPVAGATNDVHDASVLAERIGLRDEDEQRMPVVPLGEGREGLRDLRGKADWSRIHFTPVTVLNGQLRVGASRTLPVIGEPTQAEIVERCEHQVLKFGWPRGAAKVVVATRRATDPVEVPSGGPGYDEIDKVVHENLGGLQFRQRLPWQGCVVDLVGIAFEDRNAEFGSVVRAVYPGLIRLRYTIETRQRMFRLDKLVLRVQAETEPTPIPAFALVHRRDRLPLHVDDGDPLPVVPDIPEVRPPTRQFRPDRLTPDGSGPGWVAEVRGLTGFVRLFVDAPTGRLALLDPSPSSLRLPS
ncbi:MAG TPA: hypothetical protein VIT65_02875 [Microlunatus sp.]